MPAPEVPTVAALRKAAAGGGFDIGKYVKKVVRNASSAAGSLVSGSTKTVAGAAHGVTKTSRGAVVDTANAVGNAMDGVTSTFKHFGDDVSKTITKTGRALTAGGGKKA